VYQGTKGETLLTDQLLSEDKSENNLGVQIYTKAEQACVLRGLAEMGYRNIPLLVTLLLYHYKIIDVAAKPQSVS
jgi:hypothetical protein